MSRAKLEEYKERIDEHFKNEAKIMDDYLNEKEDCLTSKEKKELIDFIKNHELTKLCNEIST